MVYRTRPTTQLLLFVSSQVVLIHEATFVRALQRVLNRSTRVVEPVACVTRTRPDDADDGVNLTTRGGRRLRPVRSFKHGRFLSNKLSVARGRLTNLSFLARREREYVSAYVRWWTYGDDMVSGR